MFDNQNLRKSIKLQGSFAVSEYGDITFTDRKGVLTLRKSDRLSVRTDHMHSGVESDLQISRSFKRAADKHQIVPAILFKK